MTPFPTDRILIRALPLLLFLALAACNTISGGGEGLSTSAEATGMGGGPDGTEGTPSPAPAPLENLAPGQRPEISSDEAGLWLQVERAEDILRTAGNRVRDPALTAYLEALVCKVAGDYCPDFRVYVMRQPGLNASMMPNGTMQIWTGLLLRVEDEAQLSTVIGHEIGHYLRRHGIQRMRKTIEATSGLVSL